MRLRFPVVAACCVCVAGGMCGCGEGGAPADTAAKEPTDAASAKANDASANDASAKANDASAKAKDASATDAATDDVVAEPPAVAEPPVVAGRSDLATQAEVLAVDERSSYEAPESPNPEGVGEDDIVVLRDGDTYRMGYVGENGEFVEIPERGRLQASGDGFLPPYPIYQPK